MKQVNKNILYEKVSGHIGLTMVLQKAWKCNDDARTPEVLNSHVLVLYSRGSEISTLALPQISTLAVFLMAFTLILWQLLVYLADLTIRYVMSFIVYTPVNKGCTLSTLWVLICKIKEFKITCKENSTT